MLAFLFPVSQFVRQLVLEKEAKLREGLKMMGLTEAIYAVSWLLTLLTEIVIICILIIAVIGPTIFEYSDQGLVFVYFFSFSLAVLGFSFLMSAIFLSSKAAALIAPLVFFATFFPYFAVAGDEFS